MLQVICFLFLLFSKVLGESDDSHDCNKKWPSLDLFLPYRLNTNKLDTKYYEFESLFLRTFMMFFPLKASNVTLMVAIDGEQSTTNPAVELRDTIDGFKHQVPGGVILAHLPPSHYYRRGADRQQLAMFWADNFTTREYVGFIDTDASFITYVDREDLFEDGKPVVNAKSGYHPVAKDGVWRWTSNSYISLGILEPLRCMSYFPVIIKTSHLSELRDYIANYHNMSFNEAFHEKIAIDGYSQFHIMCTFLFTFKRDEYKWYVHSETPKWDGIDPPPIFGQDGNLSQFTPEMRLPKPRIATHVGYRRCPMNPIVSYHLFSFFLFVFGACFFSCFFHFFLLFFACFLHFFFVIFLSFTVFYSFFFISIFSLFLFIFNLTHFLCSSSTFFYIFLHFENSRISGSAWK